MNGKVLKRGIFGLLVTIATVIAAFALVACGNDESSSTAVELELDTTEVRTTFGVGESFSASGLKVVAIVDGTRYIASHAEYEVTAPDMTSMGEKTVTIGFMGASASYTITVSAPRGKLSSITLDAGSAKKIFTEGDKFVAEGLKVTAQFEGGTSSEVDISECAFSGYDMSATGNQTVIVIYGGKTATYQITVNAAVLDKISVDYSKAKREYVVNETFGYEGLAVTAHYTNGTSKVLDKDEYSVSTPDMTAIGVKTVTVTFGQKTAEYMIYAIPGVNWDTYKMDFANQSSTSDTLELFITKIEGGGGSDKDATTEGWYLLKRTDGTYAMYEFRFTYAHASYQSTFSTQGLDKEYIDDSAQGKGDLFVEIGSLKFRAGADYWHNKVMSWPMPK